MSKADICIIYNPCAGRGAGDNRFKRLKRIVGARAEYWPTERPEHGTELARLAVEEGFKVVAAAGGDGTVHEVGNGFLEAESESAVFAVVPLGSANDYAFSLGLASEWWNGKHSNIGVRHVDVGVIRSGERWRYFLNGMGVGFNGAVTLEARKIRFWRGVPLYLLGLLRAMKKRFHAPPLTITFDGQQRQLATLAFTIGLGQREGKFLLTPKAKLDDGLFDYLHVGPMGRLNVVGYVPGMIRGALPEKNEHMESGNCQRVTIESQESLIIHTDGEFFCVPDDDIHFVQIELLPKRLKVLGKLAS